MMVNIENILISIISGVAKYKNEKEIWIEVKRYEDFTIEPIDLSIGEYIIRQYFDNGSLCTISHYKNKLLDGKFIGCYENGNKYAEIDYVNGKIHGKDIRYYKDGDIQCSKTYINGKEIIGAQNE